MSWDPFPIPQGANAPWPLLMGPKKPTLLVVTRFRRKTAGKLGARRVLRQQTTSLSNIRMSKLTLDGILEALWTPRDLNITHASHLFEDLGDACVQIRCLFEELQLVPRFLASQQVAVLLFKSG